ncbi:hypothetical protein GCM10020295_53590 [Streptomyces cinereospinus]
MRSAAAGVAAGGCLMVAVQLPVLLRQLRGKGAGGPEEDGAPQRRTGLALVCAVLLFALCRQSQVLVERFLASHLDPGAISHLNYAQKVAQIPMTLSLMLCTVTFPVVARALADGDTGRARERVERDLALAASVVLLGAATVVACAPQIIQVLFQRGAFTAQDTAATAAVMRVYALGLLAQTLVGALVRSYFSDGRPSWYPPAAMTAGVAATAGRRGVGGGAVGGERHRRGERGGDHADGGAAARRGAGGRRSRRGTGRLRARGPHRRPAPPAPCAHGPRPAARRRRRRAAAGLLAASRFAAPLPGLLLGGLTVAVVFVLLGRVLGEQGVAAALRSVRSVTGRLPYVRSR